MIWNKNIKKRIIGLYGDILSENLLIVLVGIHGNEHAGIKGVQRVFDTLKSNNYTFNGCILALKGNMKAMEENKRFIDKDLNRLWNEDQIQRIKQTEYEDLIDHEDKEQKELLFILEQFTIHREAKEPFLFLDLHTTSAEGGLFTIVNGNDMSVKMARKLQIPLILHLNKVIKNTTLSIFSKREFSAIALEAGQHDHPSSVQRIESAIYILLQEMNILSFEPSFIEQHREYLKKEAIGLPIETEFKYKHTILSDDHFNMLPGFKNFDAIQKNQILAEDKNGAIMSKEDGYILMPLYQKQGEDGFFIIK